MLIIGTTSPPVNELPPCLRAKTSVGQAGPVSIKKSPKLKKKLEEYTRFIVRAIPDPIGKNNMLDFFETLVEEVSNASGGIGVAVGQSTEFPAEPVEYNFSRVPETYLKISVECPAVVQLVPPFLFDASSQVVFDFSSGPQTKSIKLTFDYRDNMQEARINILADKASPIVNSPFTDSVYKLDDNKMFVSMLFSLAVKTKYIKTIEFSANTYADGEYPIVGLDAVTTFTQDDWNLSSAPAL